MQGLTITASMKRASGVGCRLVLLLAASLLAACATTRPWLNAPLDPSVPAEVASVLKPSPPMGVSPVSPSVLAAVAISGGGARAAAFGLGVLEELKATRFELDGRPTTLLDGVGLISGISGGSILAAYYAAFGDQVFTRFGPEFLDAHFQPSLIRSVLSPVSLYQLTSPWYGRSDALAAQFDRLYDGLTFGDLQRRAHGPQLLVTATDLTTGGPFEFTPEQFALICSDLHSVPLSFAVAASSSVPVLLTPMTIRNYSGSCPQSRDSYADAKADNNLPSRLLRLIARSYEDSHERPYIHLVDGGVIDNLGVRGLLAHLTALGSLGQSFAHLPPRSVRDIVLISVNSERDPRVRIDYSDTVPSTRQVLDSLVFGTLSWRTAETTAMLTDAANRLAAELEIDRRDDASPFATDAQLYLVSISLADVPEAEVRQQLLQVPTAFSIQPQQAELLRESGRKALRASPTFQKLLHHLNAESLQ